MEAEGTVTTKLSAAARSRVDWKRINDITAGARTRSSPMGETHEVDPDRVREIFRVAKEEFQTALNSLRTLTRLTMWLVVAAAGVAIVGLLLAVYFNLRIPGAVTSLVSLGTLVGLVYKMWQLGRDQAMLELIPSRYEVALMLANSPAQFSRILDQFLAETESLRRAA